MDECVALACEYIRRFAPGLIILGGDILDAASVSRFIKLGDTPTNLATEIEALKAYVLLPIWAAATHGKNDPRIVYIEGNHEYRLDAFIAANAKALENFPGLNLPDALQLSKYKIEYIKSKKGNGQFQFGSVRFQHGERYGVNPARGTLQDIGCHTIFGHTHRESHSRMTFGSGTDWIALGAGCLCKPPDYRDISTQSYGFVAGWIDEEKERFDAHHKRIYVETIGKATKAELYTEYGTMVSRFDGKRKKCVVEYS
jgi:hypothetical protein